MTDLVVCASYEERRALRKSRPARPLGLGCATWIPEGPVRLRTYFGGLTNDLPIGTQIAVRSLVDPEGVEIWRPDPTLLSQTKGIKITAVAVTRIVDDPRERKDLHERTGAYAATMEASPLARAGVLKTASGVISDNPDFPLGLLAGVMTPEGALDISAFLWAWRLDPFGTARGIRNIWPARRVLSRMS